ncbi:MAG: amino acid permease [Micrococcaceae bacterium]
MNIWQTKAIEDSIKDSSSEGRTLKRSLNALDLAIMGVAVAIGAGIFSVGAKAAAVYAGPAVILSFILAGITCALAIMCYAEFASSMPVAGSAYTYTYTTMGELLAWIIGWDLILELLTAASVIANYWGIYLSNVFEIFGINIPSSIHFGGLELTWGPFIIVTIFTFLLVKGTKLSSRVNTIFTLLKIGIVLFVIIVGAFYIKTANYHPFIPPSQAAQAGSTGSDVWGQPLLQFISGMQPAHYGIMGIMSGAALVFFAFIGFDIVATSAEEVENPQKNLPRGIFGGLAIVTTLYILVSLVVTGMVPYTELAKAKDPSLSTAFMEVGANWAASIIALGILIGLTTVIMVLLLGLSRVIFAMSRDGLFPYSWSKTSDEAKTPVGIQIAAGLIVAFIAGFTNVGVLEEMINIGTMSAFVLVSVGIIILRKKRPDLKASYRVPFSPVIPILSAVLCLYLMLNLTTLTWVRFIVWLIIGLAVYFGYGAKHSRLSMKKNGQLPLEESNTSVINELDPLTNSHGTRTER